MPTADELLGPDVVRTLIDRLAVAAPGYVPDALAAALAGLPGTALSDRVRAVRDALLADLPAGYRPFAAVIERALADPEFTGWLIWPVSEAVATLAVKPHAVEPRTVEPRAAEPRNVETQTVETQVVEPGAVELREVEPQVVESRTTEPPIVELRDVEPSDGATVADSRTDGAPFEDGLALLARLTPRLTGEFALRTFLAADLDRTLAVVLDWTTHPDEHVRRLASEGTRARLPWARRVRELLERPEATVPILDALYRDESEYVRRSVANHLNDLSRADPALAVATAAAWTADPAPHTAALVRHALRTLVKAGDPAALALLGFAAPTDVALTGMTLRADVVPEHGELGFAFTVTNHGAAAVTVVIDYVVHHRKANGTLSPKVFKLTTRTLAPGVAVTVERTHSFRPISTRRYHPGEHALELQVNGVRQGPMPFVYAP